MSWQILYVVSINLFTDDMDQVTPSNINQADGSFISALGGEAKNLAEQRGAKNSVREKEKAEI